MHVFLFPSAVVQGTRREVLIFEELELFGIHVLVVAELALVVLLAGASQEELAWPFAAPGGGARVRSGWHLAHFDVWDGARPATQGTAVWADVGVTRGVFAGAFVAMDLAFHVDVVFVFVVLALESGFVEWDGTVLDGARDDWLGFFFSFVSGSTVGV
jgi:hypothetical protein